MTEPAPAPAPAPAPETEPTYNHKYFVSYTFYTKKGSHQANGEIKSEKPFDNYQLIQAVEQYLIKDLRKNGRKIDRIVITNWIELDASK